MTDEHAARLVEWRHHFHRHPEVGFDEHDTSEFIAQTLTGFGIDVVRGVGGTGVVGTLTRGEAHAAGRGRAIGLRADMDALTLQEVGGHDHRSTRDGVMHACGHDGHMTMLLGAAAALATDGAFDGTVRFVFQPAEEHGRGASAMLDDGLLERFPMDAMYGLHNIPGLPAGHLHTRAGAIMASEDNFTITVHGRGGHASRPQAVIDPLLVAAEIVVALQSIVARSVDPLDTAVVSCTEIHGDGARNAIPSTVVISGDTRSFAAEVEELLGRRIREIAGGVCAAHGATCDVSYTNSFRPTINDPGCAEVAVAAAIAAVGTDRVDGHCPPIMASEDFAAYAERIPACFVFVGNGVEVGLGGTPLHSRDYDFNDDILTAGVDFYVNLVHQQLAGAAR
jgi:hippurate hydrolase